MKTTLVIHVAAGALALISGYVALYASKGAPVHRRVGMVFVYSMLVMTSTGLVMTIVRSVEPAANILGAVMASYLVVTGLATVRPPPAARWLNLAALLGALAIGAAGLTFGFEALASGGRRNGVPAFPFFMFAVIALLGAGGDLRVMRSGPPRGAPRLARHLWRMSFALLIAAMSFFLGQMKVIPEPIRMPALLALPVLAVLGTMIYWIWRVRFRRSLRGVAVRDASRDRAGEPPAVEVHRRHQQHQRPQSGVAGEVHP